MADADVDTDTTDEAGPDTAPPADEWTPPSKADWDKIQRALAKANGEAKTRREELAALRKQGEDEGGKAAREAVEAAERRLKPVAVRSAAKAAFLEAGLQGVTPERVAKLVRMLDLDAITIDDDGDVIGLDDQVKSVKSDYPELFQAQDKKPPRVTTSDRPGTNGRPKRSSDLLAAQVLGP